MRLGPTSFFGEKLGPWVQRAAAPMAGQGRRSRISGVVLPVALKTGIRGSGDQHVILAAAAGLIVRVNAPKLHEAACGIASRSTAAASRSKMQVLPTCISLGSASASADVHITATITARTPKKVGFAKTPADAATTTTVV